jgi:hypothetical protein
MRPSIDEVLRRSVLAACLGLASAAAAAAPPHEHGVAQLAAVLEGEALTLAFTLPLDSLLGFERAPRTAAENQAADRAIDKLRRDADIVRPDPAAQCERSDVTLVSAALGLGSSPTFASGEEHADIDATYTFRCKQPARLAQIELPVMAAFPRVARIEVQTVAAKGQGKQTVKRASPKILWPR